MKTSTIAFFIVASAYLATTVLGCRCIPKTFKEAYDAANSVVRAKVLSVGPYIPICNGAPCFTLAPGTVVLNLLVKLRLTRTFKGCGPPSRIFYIKTASSGAACGVSLTTGKFYMFNLPLPSFVRRLGQPTMFYHINSCQFHRLFSTLTRPEKRSLRLCSKLPQNQCIR